MAPTTASDVPDLVRKRIPVLVVAFGLVLAACASTEDGSNVSVDQSTTSSVHLTSVSVQSTTSTTFAANTTTAPFSLVSLTPNAGEIQVIVPVDGDGQPPGDTEIGCVAGSRFDASALNDIPLLSEVDLPGVEAAIRPFLESEEGVYWPQDGWRVLHRSDDLVQLVHLDGSATETSIAFMDTEFNEGEWRWAGSSMGGGCPLEVKMPAGLNAVDWRLDPSTEPLTPESTVIYVLVTERACASGQELGDRLLGPEVIVSDVEVRIAFAAKAQDGVQSCQGNPETVVAIELSGAIGSRIATNGLLLDGSLEDFLQR